MSAMVKNINDITYGFLPLLPSSINNSPVIFSKPLACSNYFSQNPVGPRS